MMFSLVFFIVPALLLFGYQSVLESKGINDPNLAISLYKTSIIMDIPIKLLFFCFISDIEVFAITCLFSLLIFVIWFYVSLSLNIPKKSLRKFRKFPQNTNYTMCAFKVVVWCTLSISFNILLLLFGWNYEDPIVIYILSIVMIIMMLFYMILAAKSLIRLDRLKYPSTRSLNALSNNNSPIVLLRSFKIDCNPANNGKVFDETICENLDLNNNPIVSLANPDEILPSGGSLKIQAKDSEWKEVVKEILKNCRAVILVEGLSDGLHWEISKLKEYLDHKQLFVMVPSKIYRELAWCYNDEAGTGLYSILRNAHHFIAKITFSGRKQQKQMLNEIWTDFSLKLQKFGINIPTNFPGDNCLISFDEKWNGITHMGMSNMDQKLKYVVSRTSTFNRTDFDYPNLGKKIASFEVNGFLDKNEVAPFKQLVDKFNRVGLIVALVCFILFIAIMFLF